MIINDEYDALTIEITIDNEGKKIKDFLYENLNFSNRLIRRLKKGDHYFLNGRPVTVDKNLFRGDLLKVYFLDEKINYEPEDIPIDVLYEDGDLLVLNKPSGIVVHPTKTHKEHTLANGIAHYFKEHNIKRKIRFINRLDMDTSGIILIAKNSYCHQYIQDQMNNNTIEKRYIALVEGTVEPQEGTIELMIGKKEKGDIKRKVFEEGKPSVTEFKVLERYAKGSLLELKLLTGRTHQIRVHLSHLGYPIAGDTLYGGTVESIDRQALHSCAIQLLPPRKNEPIEIKSELPKDMLAAIEKMKER
jgi:23S rRNA pseudouridine1911/1915/1917 synthase